MERNEIIKEKGIVLIIDDEKSIRLLLQNKLTTDGYHCLLAEDAAAAIDKLNAESVDLVLLDINLPGKPGLELLPEIKKGYPDVVVIMASSVSDIDTAVDAIRLGAYDYITKPFDLNILIHSVNRGIEKRRMELELRHYQQHLEESIAEQSNELSQRFMGAMQSLVFALEATDRYTAGHSRRVSEISMAIGKKLCLDDEQMTALRWGSLLHDIGKIAISQITLNKPDRLTPEEYQHVISHTVIGASIMQPVVRNENIIAIIEHHHDHYNGRGLHQKVQREDIPLLARIVALADAYDAMTSHRPYRAAMSYDKAIMEIRNEIGRQFDPLVAKAFLELSQNELLPEKKKILVADDEPSIRLLTRSVLSNNYAVIEAANGSEAVKAAIEHKPSLILMDILMPVMDGLKAVHELKSRQQTKEIPVIMLTAIDQKLNRKISANLGANDYIVKPFHPQELLDSVARFIR
jgi:putative two-component system response regulator